MNFIGTGNRLSNADYADLARTSDIDEALLRAVVKVEAASVGFDDANRLRILFEPHVFYRLLGAGTKRDRAVALGVAYKTWKTKPYPRTSSLRYEQLASAMRIDEHLALQSASWGLGQLMGHHYASCGFTSPQDFIAFMLRGEREQLDAMIDFMDTEGLTPHLVAHRWASFARAYNGPRYAENNYDTKLEQAYLGFKGTIPMDSTSDLPLLMQGMSGPNVTLAQQRLVEWGYDPGTVDGEFGAKTKTAVEALQLTHPETGMVDGKIGKLTWNVLLADPSQAVPSQEVVLPPAPLPLPPLPTPPATQHQTEIPVAPASPIIPPTDGVHIAIPMLIVLAVISALIWARKKIAAGLRAINPFPFRKKE